MNDIRISVTTTAPVNIAVIKYWGKRDEILVLPINSSLSVTLHQKALHSKTTVSLTTKSNRDTMSLNGKDVSIKESKRLTKVISLVRSRAQDLISEDGKVIVKKEDWDQYNINIVSYNNFPTAAGLASSASGLACLTAALCTLFAVKERFPGELSMIARQGSGSACRSMYGGFAKWNCGFKPDGSDSMALPIVDENYWPGFCILILVASSREKDVGSTPGMRRSVKTSPLLSFRAKELVDKRMKLMEKYILERNFPKFAELTMQDSNQFHATCLDSYPPIFYLNETSRKVIQTVHRFNRTGEEKEDIRLGYTFDAGPNAVLFCMKKNLDEVMEIMFEKFLPSNPRNFLTDPLKLVPRAGEMMNAVQNRQNMSGSRGVERMILTIPGPGPQSKLL